jgi:hypothetical protein
MKMPPAFAEQARQAAEDIPRQVIANVLERLLPRVLVARRPAEPAQPGSPAPFVQDATGQIRPTGTPLSRADKRPSQRAMLPMLIVATSKGARKARWKGEHDTLNKIIGAGTVRQALMLSDVKFGDITYAWKTGYIDILTV